MGNDLKFFFHKSTNNYKMYNNNNSKIIFQIVQIYIYIFFINECYMKMFLRKCLNANEKKYI